MDESNQSDRNSRHHRSVCMMGTLEPWGGITPYCRTLFDELKSKNEISINFLNWKALYPKFLYPGEKTKISNNFPPESEVDNLLEWYNPLSWVIAGLKIDSDILHAQWWSYPLFPAYFIIFIMCMLRDIEIIVTVHNIESHETEHRQILAEKLLFLFPDGYIVHGEENRELFSQRHSIDEEKVTVIDHPNITTPPNRDIKPEKARKELGVSLDSSVVLFFGNIREYKGLDDLVRVVSDLDTKIPNLEFIIAGRCWEDWSNYEEQIHRNSIQNITHTQIEFIDENEIEYYFRSADVVVLPYKKFDAQSGVASLANYYDTLSVAKDLGGLNRQVDFTAHSTDDLQNLLLEILCENKYTSEKSIRINNNKIAENHISMYSDF